MTSRINSTVSIVRISALDCMDFFFLSFSAEYIKVKVAITGTLTLGCDICEVSGAGRRQEGCGVKD